MKLSPIIAGLLLPLLSLACSEQATPWPEPAPRRTSPVLIVSSPPEPAPDPPLDNSGEEGTPREQLAGAEYAGEAAAARIPEIIAEMRASGRRFNPAKLHQLGLPGLRALLDHLLPQTAQGGRLPEAETGDRAPEYNNALPQAFGIYLEEIDDASRLRELAHRTRSALQNEEPGDQQRQILTRSLAAVARSGNDEICNLLRPLLDHDNEATARWVTRIIGSASGNHYFPALLLEALESRREGVVDEALNWTPNCWDREKAAEVRRLVTRIFEGDNEELKFQACFPLMHSFGDERAMDYLITQVQSSDPGRARRAISWIGDTCNHGRIPPSALLEQLTPVLKVKDNSLRRVAADALGTYQGEEVVRQLIPRLADEQAIIVAETRRNLLQQRDKEMLRRLLTWAADNSLNAAIRQEAATLLEELDR